MQTENKKLSLEVIIVTAILVAVTSGLHALQAVPFINKIYSLVFALMFLYVPVEVIRKRGREIDFLDRSPTACLKSIATFFAASLIVFPVFLVAAHGWEKVVYDAAGPRFALPVDIWRYSFFQLIMIALPEEFFFRGYFQSALNIIFPKKWRILGAGLGWGWIITAAVFAACHSIVVLQWWHFAIFFPALLFGYLRERTGAITAPILFHALCNIVENWVVYIYR